MFIANKEYNKVSFFRWSSGLIVMMIMTVMTMAAAAANY